MKEVWQTYTDNKKKASEDASLLFKTYNVSVYSPSFSYIATCYILLLFVIPIVASRFLPIKETAVLFVIMVLGLVATLKGMKTLFTEKKAIELHDDKLIIKGTETLVIPLDNIKDYNTTWSMNAVNLVIRPKNGRKIKLGYSSGYGDISGLEKLIEDFESQMNKQSLSNLIAGKRKRSFIESPWMLALLILMTFVTLANIAQAFYLHFSVPPGIWVCSGLTSAFWSLYITTRSRNRGIRPTGKNIMDLHRELNKTKD